MGTNESLNIFKYTLNGIRNIHHFGNRQSVCFFITANRQIQQRKLFAMYISFRVFGRYPYMKRSRLGIMNDRTTYDFAAGIEKIFTGN